MNRWLLAVAICLVSTSAFAQTQAPDRTVFRKHTELRFDEVPITGGTAHPSDSYIPVRRPHIFKNLINIRGDFQPELQKSVDQL